MREYVTVGPRKIRIVYEKLDDLHGEYISDKQIIKIDEDDDEELQLSTLFHEIMHACFDVSGLKYLMDVNGGMEEAVIRCVENLALPAITDYHIRKAKNVNNKKS